MGTIHPQFITDSVGEKLVVLPIKEFNNMLEELEDMEDVHLYDLAKKNDTGERVPMEEVFKMIEDKRKNKD